MATTQPTLYSAFPSQPAYTTPPNSQGAHPHYNILHHQQRQYSPQASHPHTPIPNSPSSPQPGNFPGADFFPLPLGKRAQHSPDHGRPIYLPAALRPTNPPPRSQPLTPPRSVHGSTDSLQKKDQPSRPGSRRSTTAPSIKGPSHQVVDELLAHLPPGDLDLAFTYPQISPLPLPEISGPPTREHWKPDANAYICDDPTCPKQFGLWERRHHCRKCGNIFCNEHSRESVPLDQNADFHVQAEKVRTCAHCAEEWVAWVEDRIRRLKEGENGAEMERTNPVGVLGRETSAEQSKAGFIAGSVGVTGDWSTF